MRADDIAAALKDFAELSDLAAAFLQRWSRGDRQFQIGALEVKVIIGDARDMLARWNGTTDAWFLDGFSPAKNPELWGADLMQVVASHTNPGGTFATYTAAGHVRRGLEAAGFVVERRAGFGRKRHMSVGRLAGDKA
ncbi:MAG: tRNA (5-methylaminomethyl-2-thiouridine)(34)-methyltransferase MnmD, partial [Rhodobacteraceae bacterium]|nr:tRNA (5-methylaminomethyl-2-thiouridine)(34)-methyltransferase MnmD [Paracoccaceae bacterium]